MDFRIVWKLEKQSQKLKKIVLTSVTLFILMIPKGGKNVLAKSNGLFRNVSQSPPPADGPKHAGNHIFQVGTQ